MNQENNEKLNQAEDLSDSEMEVEVTDTEEDSDKLNSPRQIHEHGRTVVFIDGIPRHAYYGGGGDC
jgi:hypothetical protein